MISQFQAFHTPNSQIFKAQTFLRATCFSAVALLGTACTTMSPPASVADTIAQDNNFSTLSRLVSQAGLADTLKSSGPFTVFAPTNEAFSAVPAKTMDELSKDPAKLKSVLSYHVLPAKLTSNDLVQANVKTVQGSNVAVSKAGNFTTVEDAMVVKADIAASNGVVHAIDRVLIPPKQ
jgi:uncharacterized surface protein with fasciclin (FAS1) repeats